MLRRKASPTEATLRLERSHIVNEALEMIAAEQHLEERSDGFIPFISTDPPAQRYTLGSASF